MESILLLFPWAQDFGRNPCNWGAWWWSLLCNLLQTKVEKKLGFKPHFWGRDKSNENPSFHIDEINHFGRFQADNCRPVGAGSTTTILARFSATNFSGALYAKVCHYPSSSAVFFFNFYLYPNATVLQQSLRMASTVTQATRHILAERTQGLNIWISAYWNWIWNIIQ